MLRALKNNTKAIDNKKEAEKMQEKYNGDIIVARHENIEEYKDKKRITYQKRELINVTKKINATKDLIKEETIEEKLKKLSKGI